MDSCGLDRARRMMTSPLLQDGLKNNVAGDYRQSGFRRHAIPTVSRWGQSSIVTRDIMGFNAVDTFRCHDSDNDN